MALRTRKQGSKKTQEAEASDINTVKETNSQISNSSNEKTTSIVPWRRIITRFLLSMCMVFAVYWTSQKNTENAFATQKEKLQLKSLEMTCSPDYQKEVSKFKECMPKHCGRLVTDIVISPEESAHLLRLCKKGLAFGGSDGGASILDLHSGALSFGNSFINIYQKLKSSGKKDIFTTRDFEVYRNVRNKIQQMIAYNFGAKVNKLYLTHPTFFSEMSTRSAKTTHDEYWHVHVDKETYPSFHYTSLLYLTDYGVDFSGGRFIFVGKTSNITVEPRIGRVSAFTSGAENPHFVERVASGVRYALTVSFTCDPQYAISDPSMEKIEELS